MNKLELEARMLELLAKGKKSKFIKLKFGSTEFKFNGGLRELADFLDKSGLNQLESIKKDGESYFYSADGADSKYAKAMHYTEKQSLELIADIDIVEEDIYDRADVDEFVGLQAQYRALCKIEQAKKETEKSNDD